MSALLARCVLGVHRYFAMRARPSAITSATACERQHEREAVRILVLALRGALVCCINRPCVDFGIHVTPSFRFERILPKKHNPINVTQIPSASYTVGLPSAERHKSDCRSTAGEDQQGLRVCGLEGRRSMQ